MWSNVKLLLEALCCLEILHFMTYVFEEKRSNSPICHREYIILLIQRGFIYIFKYDSVFFLMEVKYCQWLFIRIRFCIQYVSKTSYPWPVHKAASSLVIAENLVATVLWNRYCTKKSIDVFNILSNIHGGDFYWE